MKSASALVASIMLVAHPAFAEGISPAEFLGSLSGEFQGKGEALMSVTQEKVRIQCKLENTYDTAKQQLYLSGKCATTQGKRKIDGTLTIVEDSIKGSFLSPSSDSEITKTSSVFKDGQLVTYISVVNKTSGALTRIRQILSVQDENRFKSRFQRFDNASDQYHDTGVVTFIRRQTAQTN